MAITLPTSLHSKLSVKIFMYVLNLQLRKTIFPIDKEIFELQLQNLVSLIARIYCISSVTLLSSFTVATVMADKKLSFVENFGLSGAAAIISKTAAAPIERVKLLVQNQDEMLKAGRLSEPYKGVVDCTLRTYKTEGEKLQ